MLFYIFIYLVIFATCHIVILYFYQTKIFNSGDNVGRDETLQNLTVLTVWQSIPILFILFYLDKQMKWDETKHDETGPKYVWLPELLEYQISSVIEWANNLKVKYLFEQWFNCVGRHRQSNIIWRNAKRCLLVSNKMSVIGWPDSQNHQNLARFSHSHFSIWKRHTKMYLLL